MSARWVPGQGASKIPAGAHEIGARWHLDHWRGGEPRSASRARPRRHAAVDPSLESEITLNARALVTSSSALVALSLAQARLAAPSFAQAKPPTDVVASGRGEALDRYLAGSGFTGCALVAK